MISIQRAVAHARRVNKLVVEHKKAGDLNASHYCAGMRAMWMCEARNAASKDEGLRFKMKRNADGGPQFQRIA